MAGIAHNTAQTKRLRVKFSEVEEWLRSTRVPVMINAEVSE